MFHWNKWHLLWFTPSEQKLNNWSFQEMFSDEINLRLFNFSGDLSAVMLFFLTKTKELFFDEEVSKIPYQELKIHKSINSHPLFFFFPFSRSYWIWKRTEMCHWRTVKAIKRKENQRKRSKMGVREHQEKAAVVEAKRNAKLCKCCAYLGTWI